MYAGVSLLTGATLNMKNDLASTEVYTQLISFGCGYTCSCTIFCDHGAVSGCGDAHRCRLLEMTGGGEIFSSPFPSPSRISSPHCAPPPSLPPFLPLSYIPISPSFAPFLPPLTRSLLSFSLPLPLSIYTSTPYIQLEGLGEALKARPPNTSLGAFSG